MLNFEQTAPPSMWRIFFTIYSLRSTVVLFKWEFECTQTLLVALLDDPLDKGWYFFVSLEKAVQELTCLLSTHS